MKIGIIGYGRFGRLWAHLLAERGHEILVYDQELVVSDHDSITIVTLESVVKTDMLFLAVPISILEDVCKQIAPLLSSQTIVADVASVKVHPAAILQRVLPLTQPMAGTHPLFGPDSAARSGIEGKKIVVCPLRGDAYSAQQVAALLRSLGLEVVFCTPEEHDRVMARSQALVHFIGRGLSELHLKSELFSTPDYESLIHINEMVGNDTWQLFYDIERHNPFAPEVRQRFLDKLLHIEQDIVTKGDGSLLALRGRISEIDQRILRLLGERCTIARHVGQFKRDNNQSITDLQREEELWEEWKLISIELQLDSSFVRSLFDQIIKESKRLQQEL